MGEMLNIKKSLYIQHFSHSFSHLFPLSLFHLCSNFSLSHLYSTLLVLIVLFIFNFSSIISLIWSLSLFNFKLLYSPQTVSLSFLSTNMVLYMRKTSALCVNANMEVLSVRPRSVHLCPVNSQLNCLEYAALFVRLVSWSFHIVKKQIIPNFLY